MALEAKELAFTTFLEQRGLVLRTDLLGVWSGWCTPVFEPRRFRTWFFVAALPEGQRTRDVSTESSSVTWMGAAAACDAVDAGELGMMPPTYVTCLDVAQHASPAEVLAAAPTRVVEMFTPTVEGSGADATLSIPPALVPLVEARPSGDLGGWVVRLGRAVCARPQRVADDPGRHEHLGAPRPRVVPVGRGGSRGRRMLPIWTPSPRPPVTSPSSC